MRWFGFFRTLIIFEAIFSLPVFIGVFFIFDSPMLALAVIGIQQIFYILMLFWGGRWLVRIMATTLSARPIQLEDLGIRFDKTFKPNEIFLTRDASLNIMAFKRPLGKWKIFLSEGLMQSASCDDWKWFEKTPLVRNG